MYVNEYIKNTYRVKDHENRDGYLRLDMNENPEGLPTEFVDDVIKKITIETIARYPQKDNLIRLIAESEDIDVSNITLTNGSDEGIRLIFETFTKPSAKVVTVSPTFEMYKVYASMFGVQNVVIEYDKNFKVEISDILNKIDKDTNIVALLNPNSPISTEYTDVEFRTIIEKARQMESLVVIDEAYYPFGVDTQMQLIKEYDNVVILRTFSKLFSMAGVRIGYMAGNSELIHYIENAQSTFNVNSIGILFAEELLKRKDIIKEMIETEKTGRDYLVDKLEKSEYEYYAQNGNYILIKTKKEPKLVANYLKENKILIKSYGNPLLSQWIRVTTGSKNILEQFWKEFCIVEGVSYE